MEELKVFIIDPHVLVRQTITNIIRRNEEYVVAGCSDGKQEEEIFNLIKDRKPDVLFLGIDEVDSDTDHLFQKVRKGYPSLPVIVMTPLNKKGSEIALNSLKKGAVEFITKPESSRCLTFSANRFEKRIIPLLKIVKDLNMTSLVESPLMQMPEKAEGGRFNSGVRLSGTELVVIGGCTGGVRSLYKIILGLPANLPVPVLVVQHMPKIYTETFSRDLDRYSELKVTEIRNNSTLMPGTVYIAPGGYHTIVKSTGSRRMLSLYRGPKVHRSRPSIDVMFWSAAQVYRDRVLGILLSGEGRDGIEGARHIADAGGEIITESKKTSPVWQLPRNAKEQDITGQSYDSDKLAEQILKRIYSRERERTPENMMHSDQEENSVSPA